MQLDTALLAWEAVQRVQLAVRLGEHPALVGTGSDRWLPGWHYWCDPALFDVDACVWVREDDPVAFAVPLVARQDGGNIAFLPPGNEGQPMIWAWAFTAGDGFDMFRCTYTHGPDGPVFDVVEAFEGQARVGDDAPGRSILRSLAIAAG